MPFQCLERRYFWYSSARFAVVCFTQLIILADNKVVFCTGGAGTICSVQVKGLVYLGANAFIIGRNPAKTESMAAEMSRLRPGAKVIGMGNVDVRKIDDLNKAVDRCVQELGAIDYVMYDPLRFVA